MSRIILNIENFPKISFHDKNGNYHKYNTFINEDFNEENGDFSRDFSIYELNIFNVKTLGELYTQITEQFGFDEFGLISQKN